MDHEEMGDGPETEGEKSLELFSLDLSKELVPEEKSERSRNQLSQQAPKIGLEHGQV